MIELNNVSLFGHNNSTTGGAITAQSNASSSSFQSQLSAALTATLEQFGVDPSKINITIGPITNSPSTVPASSSPAATVPASNTPAATVPASNTPTATGSSSGAQSDAQIMAYDDAYWAGQPTAVQALRNIDDPDQRSNMAAQLAASGYQIDVPVMVWGWDPSKVTDLRQNFGYSWVPSAGQNPVPAAPGISWPGAEYDPNNPPTGSILV